MFRLQIALCDDKQQPNILKAFLQAYETIHGLELTITHTLLPPYL